MQLKLFPTDHFHCLLWSLTLPLVASPRMEPVREEAERHLRGTAPNAAS